MAHGVVLDMTEGHSEEPIRKPIATQLDQSAEQLAEELVQDAREARSEPECSALWVAAGELYEFGIGDIESAFRCYSQAVGEAEPTPVALAGLRRLARHTQRGLGKLGELYGWEIESATDPLQAVKAAVQQALWLIRQKASDGYEAIVERLTELDTQDSWAKVLASTVLEDLALRAHDALRAARCKASRWELARSMLDPSNPSDRHELAQLASAVGVIHRYLTERPKTAADWFNRSYELVASECTLRELVSLKWAEQNPIEYEKGLLRLAKLGHTPGARARAYFELGLLKAYRLGDRGGAASVFLQGMREAEGSASCAPFFLSMARVPEVEVRPDDMVDALGVNLELAATPRERADCLYLMAATFEQDLHLNDAAIELLQEALAAHPDHRPAAKALSRLFQQRGDWGSLVSLLEAEVERYPESRRSRMKLVEVLIDRLSAPEKAEPHLEAIVREDLYPPAVTKLKALLAGQGRWHELYRLLCQCAQRETNLREQLFDLEQAAFVAENRLNRLDWAVQRWQEVHRLDWTHPGSLANLRRLLTSLGRWEELIEHNKAEISIRDDALVAARIWTETGEIYERHLFDEEEANRCFDMALQIDPTYEPALEARGRILWRNRDWDALIEVYEAEISACSDPLRRQQRLLDLGELQAIQAERPEAAIATFGQALKEDPSCEDALLWLERLHQSLRDETRVLSVLHSRQSLLGANPSPIMALRSATLAEWALDDPHRAWSGYLDALRSAHTRQHAVVGLWRLWTRAIENDDWVEAGLRQLVPVLRDEDDPELKAMMVVLVSRLENRSVTLQEWPAAHDQSPREVLAQSATDVQLASEGQLDLLAPIRARQRLGSLWALMAQLDAPRTEVRRALPDWLPDSPITYEVLAEMDLILSSQPGDREPGESDPNRSLDNPPEGVAAASTLTRAKAIEHRRFRELVRAWTSGRQPWFEVDEMATIAELRLMAHYFEADGELDKASHYTHLEAVRWSSPEKVQKRLTLASEMQSRSEPEASRRLYRKALECGCYHLPSRQRLYQSLWSQGHVDLLIDALRDHIAKIEEDKDRIKWLKRLASAQEHIGENAGALDSWQAIIQIEPTQVAAQLEVVRLLTFEGRLDDARKHLEQALEQRFAPPERLLLLSKLVDLNVMEGGDGKTVLKVLEEAVKLTGNDSEWMRRLARAHHTYGDPERALLLLTKALPAKVEPLDLPDWFLLARIKYSHFDDNDGARELLWGLLEQFPEEIDPLKELEVFYRNRGDASELAERLSTFLVGSSPDLTPDTREFLWEYLGDLNYQVLRRNRDAQLAYEAAGAATQETPRLALKAARAVGQQPGKGRDACSRYTAALQKEGVGIEEWIEAVEDLEAIFDGIEDPARVRIIHQIGALLTGQEDIDSSEARIKRDPARQVETETALIQLSDGLVQPHSLEAIRLLDPVLGRCLGERRARRRALGGRRIRPSDSPDFIRLVQLGADTIGGPAPKVYAGNGTDQPEHLSNGGFWLPADLFETLNELQLRFWAGHISASAALDIHAVSLAQPGEIEAMLGETVRLSGGGIPGDDRLLRELAAPRFKSTRERLAQLIEQHPDLEENVTREAWTRLPTFVADRFGLLLAGDVRAAVDSVIALQPNPIGTNRADHIVSEPRSRRLLEYALSYAYQELRYLCGLAAKPRPI